VKHPETLEILSFITSHSLVMNKKVVLQSLDQSGNGMCTLTMNADDFMDMHNSQTVAYPAELV
jgi:hypothetical protein